MKILWYQTDSKQVLLHLHTSLHGLTKEEALKRKTKYGANVIPEREGASRARVFLKQFQNSLILILLVAMVVAIIFDDPLDAAVIALTVIINVCIGYYQEYKAQNTLLKLKQVISLQAIVRRDGHEQLIAASDVVPGDLLIMRSGMKVAADGRLLKAKNLQINEASLTGESFPVDKISTVIKNESLPLADQRNMIFAGTLIVSGEGEAVVTAIGVESEIGKIAVLITHTADVETPLQKQLRRFSARLSLFILGLVLLFIVLGIARDISFREIFFSALALVVAAIPEGLILAVTVTMAIGMQNILKRKGLVRQLASAETLGSTTVICTDKTGTLTTGNMLVTAIITVKHEFSLGTEHTKIPSDVSQNLKIAMLANDVIAQHAPEGGSEEGELIGTPTGKALYRAALKADFNREEILVREKLLDIVPFTSERKYRVSLHIFDNSRNVIYVAGAPEKLFPHLTSCLVFDTEELFSDKYEYHFRKQQEKLSGQGFRVIACAYRLVPKSFRVLEDGVNPSWGHLTLAGLLALQDQVRPGVEELIRVAKEAGIRTVMITGDNRITAQTIARQLRLPSGENNMCDAECIDQLSESELSKRVDRFSMYARVSPHDKLRIVQAWQRRGEIVAMTGDGINDAPALKAADIGVAMGDGSDVTKETADLVLLDNNFETIVAAIREGRIILDNIRKVVVFLLSGSVTEIILMGTATVAGLPLPFTAAQILWLNLIQDSFPAFALAMEHGEKGVMKARSKRSNSALFDREMIFFIVLIAMVNNFFLLLLYFFLLFRGVEVDMMRTVLFAALGLNVILYAFSCRSFRKPIWRNGTHSNRYLFVASGVALFCISAALFIPSFQMLLTTVGIGIHDVGIIVILALVQFLCIEGIKSLYNRDITV